MSETQDVKRRKLFASTSGVGVVFDPERSIWKDPTPKVQERKPKKKKSSYYFDPRPKREFLQPGHQGFLATCNYREKSCVRECYNLLNQYADELYDPSKAVVLKCFPGTDIADELQKAITKNMDEANPYKSRFLAVSTKANNCVFIKTKIPDPVDLGVHIVRDIAEHKVQKARYLFRLIPVPMVCRANLKDITDATGILCDKYFLREPHTFSIVYNKRFNNSISRDELIKQLADLVTSKNVGNKVDLTNPELCVLVEVIKGMACISVLPDYIKLKKYNLMELASKPKEEQDVNTEPEDIKIESEDIKMKPEGSDSVDESADSSSD